MPMSGPANTGKNTIEGGDQIPVTLSLEIQSEGVVQCNIYVCLSLSLSIGRKKDEK